MPPLAAVSFIAPGLFWTLLVVSVVATAWGLIRYSQTGRRGFAVVAVAFALGSVAVVGVLAYGTYQNDLSENTWAFDYSLSVVSNGTGSESVVVPVPQDEPLLAGLRLTSGRANWSFVTTPRGRGLFVQFARAATLEASVALVPRPASLPDTSPTMTVPTNCTAEPSNCTGSPWLWVFYSGPAGAALDLSISDGSVRASLATGWAAYESLPRPVPVS